MAPVFLFFSEPHFNRKRISNSYLSVSRSGSTSGSGPVSVPASAFRTRFLLFHTPAISIDYPCFHFYRFCSKFQSCLITFITSANKLSTLKKYTICRQNNKIALKLPARPMESWKWTHRHPTNGANSQLIIQESILLLRSTLYFVPFSFHRNLQSIVNGGDWFSTSNYNRKNRHFKNSWLTNACSNLVSRLWLRLHVVSRAFRRFRLS